MGTRPDITVIMDGIYDGAASDGALYMRVCGAYLAPTELTLLLRLFATAVDFETKGGQARFRLVPYLLTAGNSK